MAAELPARRTGEHRSTADGSSTLATAYTYEPFGRTSVSGPTARHFLPDKLGSTLVLADAAGAVATQYTYEPFGRTTVSGAATTNSFQYTGRENDGTGLYYYRARYYHVRLSRFLSEDPAGFDPMANLYPYVANSPVTYIDPSGATPKADKDREEDCTQITPWTEVPAFRSPTTKPYAVAVEGLDWRLLRRVPITRSASHGRACICEWYAGHERVRKDYRYDYEEEAQFECGCAENRRRETRKREQTREWTKFEPGSPIFPAQTRTTLGVNAQGHSECLCFPPQ